MRRLALLHLVPLTWSHSAFSTTSCLLIPSTLGKGEEKGWKTTTEFRAVRFSYFFSFVITVPCKCWIFARVLHPNLLLSFLAHFSTLLSRFSSHCFFQISFSFLFFSFCFFTFPPIFHSPSHPCGKEKERNEMSCILTIRITGKQCSWDSICCQHISQDSKWWAFLAK